MVPEVYEWGMRVLFRPVFAGAAFLLAAVQPASPESGAAERDLTRVVYDYAVTSYCGTLTPEVEAGFRRELAILTRRHGLDEETARRQRIRGWIAADREWSNRGLGGHRAWCREEGVTAARHFQAIARGSRQP